MILQTEESFDSRQNFAVTMVHLIVQCHLAEAITFGIGPCYRRGDSRRAGHQAHFAEKIAPGQDIETAPSAARRIDKHPGFANEMQYPEKPRLLPAETSKIC